MQLRIDNKAMIDYAKQLKRLSATALPKVVRNTLNNAAFDVKTNTMPTEAKKVFVNRKPTFFKANSKVVIAKGSNINSMKATVGFQGKNSNGADKAVNELEQQEHGGKIGGRSFISLKQARASRNWNKMIRGRDRITKLDNVVNAHKVRIMKLNQKTGRMNRQRKMKQQFIKAAIMAKKLNSGNSLVLSNVYRGQQTLSRINSINRNVKNRTIEISRTPLYTYKRGRGVRIAGTNFMKRASMESGLKMKKYFIKNAEAEIRKLMR